MKAKARKGHAAQLGTTELLLLFDVNCMFSQLRAKLLQLQFFPTGLAAHEVVVIAGLFTNQEHRVRLFFPFAAGLLRHGEPCPLQTGRATKMRAQVGWGVRIGKPRIVTKIWHLNRSVSTSFS